MGASMTEEVAAIVRLQDAVRSMNLPPDISSSLLSTFHQVLRESLAEVGAHRVDDRERMCALAADAVIAFAKAGLHPEQIRRFARSNLRFMGSARKAAVHM